MNEFREWLMLVFELGIFCYVAAEYHYDKAKDDLKKTRKTRVTKRITTDKEGAVTTEETNEVTEPMNEEKK